MNRKKHIIRKQNRVKFKLVFAVAQDRVHAQRTTATINWILAHMQTEISEHHLQHKAPCMTSACVKYNT